ncbi:MAG: nonstructural protein [Microvirus sp.]|nr:MAG: nonstructural protein [Microvirus sp.]
MILKVFAIYDSAADYYLPPFTSRSVGEALRDFGTSAKDRNAGQLYSHPADFTLFEIGSYDNTVGNLIQHQAKQNLGTALEIRNRIKEPSAESNA